MFGCQRLPHLFVLIIGLSLTGLTTTNESHGEASRSYAPLAPVRGDAPIQNKTKLEPNSNFGVGFTVDIVPATDDRIISHVLSGE